ncbi:MAG: hypothetical protein AAF518_06920 [Spirochaetota bacterium]
MRQIFCLLLLTMNFCDPVKDIEPPPFYTFLFGVGQSSRVGIVSSDLGPAGRFSTMTEDGVSVAGAYTNIHSDAVAFYYNSKVYVLNRLNRDNLQILNPNLANLTENEFSLGARSNPHGIAFISETQAYISLYGEARILSVNPQAAQITASIDLSPYADADGIPEVSGLLLHDGRLYAAVQRLDRNNPTSIWPPADYSLLLEIDISTNVIVATYQTQATNPRGKLFLVTLSGEPHIVFAASGFSGSSFRLDGGVEAFNLNRKEFLPRFLYTEQIAAGDILNVVIKNDTVGYANVMFQDFSSAIQRFNPSTGEKNADLAFYPASTGFVSGMLLAPNGYLYVGDASFETPGVMIYNTNQNDARLLPSPVNIGLRPTDLIWIP